MRPRTVKFSKLTPIVMVMLCLGEASAAPPGGPPGAPVFHGVSVRTGESPPAGGLNVARQTASAERSPRDNRTGQGAPTPPTPPFESLPKPAATLQFRATDNRPGPPPRPQAAPPVDTSLIPGRPIRPIDLV
ncbi:MAG: hypothetical protein ACREHD_03540, partial [Pirellulales bacterium]